MDKEYWEAYYAAQEPSEQPSDFAKFCSKEYTAAHGIIFDVGCGNGRDSLCFSSLSIPVIGIDQCAIATAQNKQRSARLGLNCSFLQGDFSTVDYDHVAGGEYSIYSRFTLHAIDYAEESRFFSHLNSGRHLKYLFIEARSIRDSLYGQGKRVGLHEYVTSHYRRFIDPDLLLSSLKENFLVKYFEEGQGFARTETEDPCLIRLIAERR